MADILDSVGNSLDDMLGTLSDTAKKYVSLEEIIPSVSDLIIDQAKDFKVLNKELGNGSKLSSQLRGEFASLSKQLGVSTRDIFELTSVTKNYHQGVTKLTSSTLKFVKASGASTDILGNMISRMNILNSVSSESLEGMYEDILAVRDAYGLTQEQLDETIQVLDKYTVVTQASDEQIRRAAVSVAEFTSKLTSVGMAANDVSKLLKAMINPDEMMENVVLMSKIGITVNDMISGDPMEKLGESTEKLKALGQEISNIAKSNRYQANEMAKIYGLTLDEAIMLSELDTSEKSLNTQKNLEQYRNEMATFSDGLIALKNTIGGVVSGPLSKLGEILEGFGNTIGLLPKTLVAILGVAIGKKLLDKLRDKVSDIFGSAAKRFSDDFKKYLGEVGGRMDVKKGDIAAEQKRVRESNMEKSGKLGAWGYNYEMKQQQIRNSLNQRKEVLEPGNLFAEINKQYERMQKRADRVDRAKKGQNTFSTDAEYKYESKITGGWLDDLLPRMKEIIDADLGVAKRFDDNKDVLSNKNWQNAKDDKKKKEGQSNLIKASLETLGLNLDQETRDLVFKPGQNRSEMAGFLSSVAGEGKTVPQVLEALKDFLAKSDLEYKDEAIAAVTHRLNELGSEAMQQAEVMKKAENIMAEAGKAENKEVKTNRLVSLGQGIGLMFGNKWIEFKNSITSFKDTVVGIAKKAPGFIAKLPFNVAAKALKIGTIGLLAGLGKKLMTSLSKNEQFQQSMQTVTERVGEIFDGLVKAIEPVIEPVTNAILGILQWLQPAIDWVAGLLGKISNWFGVKLNSAVGKISNSVATIEDSYKKEDLRTMVGAQGQYNAQSDNIEVIGLLKNITHQIDGVTKNQKEGNNVLTVAAINSSNTATV